MVRYGGGTFTVDARTGSVAYVGRTVDDLPVSFSATYTGRQERTDGSGSVLAYQFNRPGIGSEYTYGSTTLSFAIDGGGKKAKIVVGNSGVGERIGPELFVSSGDYAEPFFQRTSDPVVAVVVTGGGDMGFMYSQYLFVNTLDRTVSSVVVSNGPRMVYEPASGEPAAVNYETDNRCSTPDNAGLTSKIFGISVNGSLKYRFKKQASVDCKDVSEGASVPSGELGAGYQLIFDGISKDGVVVYFRAAEESGGQPVMLQLHYLSGEVSPVQKLPDGAVSVRKGTILDLLEGSTKSK